MAESVESHDKLVELEVLNIMCIFLKEGKHVKLHRQVFQLIKFIQFFYKIQLVLQIPSQYLMEPKIPATFNPERSNRHSSSISKF